MMLIRPLVAAARGRIIMLLVITVLMISIRSLKYPIGVCRYAAAGSVADIQTVLYGACGHVSDMSRTCPGRRLSSPVSCARVEHARHHRMRERAWPERLPAALVGAHRRLVDDEHRLVRVHLRLRH